MKNIHNFFIMIFAVAFLSKINAQNITTLGLGYSFTYAVDIAKDSSGNLYVCDATDDLVMKVEPNNKTTVISAGKGKPMALTLDGSGYLYVAYGGGGTNSGKVFKMNTDGSNAVLFASPNTSITKMKFIGINLWYTASALSNKIGRISLSDGSIGTVNLPINVSDSEDFTFDNQGNSYFVYPNSQKFVKINNVFQTYSLSQSSGTNITCIDYCPNLGLIIGSMSDIVIMNTTGSVVTHYSLPTFPPGQLFLPQAVEAREYQNVHFIFFDTDGRYKIYDFKYPDNVFNVRGSKFNSPIGITLDAQNKIYITSNDPYTSLNQVAKIGTDNSIAHLYYSPNSLAGISFASNNNNLYFADKTENSIKKITTTGTSPGNYITGLSNPYMFKVNNITEFYIQRNYTYLIGRKFNLYPPQWIYSYYGVMGDPKGFDFDNAGNVYVADNANNNIQKINPTTGTSVNLGVIGNNFNKPSGVAVDSQHGYVYISDTENNSIKRMDLNGNGIQVISTDFFKPEGICMDETNNKLYVADTGNNVVKIINLNAFLSTSDTKNISHINIYPNPAMDFIKILNSKNQKISRAEIFEMSGKMIKNIASFSENTIDVQALCAGSYLLKIYAGTDIYYRKFLKK
ncbi:T9SS type A sorting domain-containing protein [Chryseobacterium sp. R2A-55]|uniref:T9SS type A sorting domain-containing protein n=1 Tax=Chryseobacterium sp. R2A-55 TaxID=2744445 RepID=UPI001F33490D|nr:T9SS type A sorting domain-containing protein [Chryseobacterium sp. R2A-55]